MTQSTTPASVAMTTESSGQGEKASLGVVGLMLFVAVVVVIICVRKRCVRKSDGSSSKESNSEWDEEEEGEGGMRLDGVRVSQEDLLWSEMDAESRALVKSCMIDVQRLVMGRMLGKGQFGMVYEATMAREARLSNDYGSLSHEKVAVKTLKGSNITKETIEAFLKEGMIMKDFQHKHVLSLLGVALGDHGIPMIVLPYMAGGNLKKYIGKPNLTITVRELLEFGRQIGEGMKYLGEQKFVHRDLAARNCMLDERRTVKVADFGLSRDIYTKEYYCSQDKHAKLPVKWMALESIATSKYTTKSDVWSFGVLLWELMTRGATPYPDVANWDVHKYIREGRRMAQPPICPDNIYCLMLRCWSAEPRERPSFSRIIEELTTILNPPEDEEEDAPEYVNLYANVEPGEEEVEQEDGLLEQVAVV